MQAQQPAAGGGGFGGGGFLKGALATAAGVAGGALIYDQMKGMFGGGIQNFEGATTTTTVDSSQIIGNTVKAYGVPTMTAGSTAPRGGAIRPG